MQNTVLPCMSCPSLLASENPRESTSIPPTPVALPSPGIRELVASFYVEMSTATGSYVLLLSKGDMSEKYQIVSAIRRRKLDLLMSA